MMKVLEFLLTKVIIEFLASEHCELQNNVPDKMCTVTLLVSPAQRLSGCKFAKQLSQMEPMPCKPKSGTKAG